VRTAAAAPVIRSPTSVGERAWIGSKPAAACAGRDPKKERSQWTQSTMAPVGAGFVRPQWGQSVSVPDPMGASDVTSSATARKYVTALRELLLT